MEKGRNRNGTKWEGANWEGAKWEGAKWKRGEIGMGQSGKGQIGKGQNWKGQIGKGRTGNKPEIKHANFHFSSKYVTPKSRKVEVFDLTIVKKLSTFRPDVCLEKLKLAD